MLANSVGINSRSASLGQRPRLRTNVTRAALGTGLEVRAAIAEDELDYTSGDLRPGLSWSRDRSGDRIGAWDANVRISFYTRCRCSYQGALQASYLAQLARVLQLRTGVYAKARRGHVGMLDKRCRCSGWVPRFPNSSAPRDTISKSSQPCKRLKQLALGSESTFQARTVTTSLLCFSFIQFLRDKSQSAGFRASSRTLEHGCG